MIVTFRAFGARRRWRTACLLGALAIAQLVGAVHASDFSLHSAHAVCQVCHGAGTPDAIVATPLDAVCSADPARAPRAVEPRSAPARRHYGPGPRAPPVID
jgi:hypothetical protein